MREEVAHFLGEPDDIHGFHRLAPHDGIANTRNANATALFEVMKILYLHITQLQSLPLRKMLKY